jgi:acyl phosphate:glycerol-3-phosphate acyltransferase
MIEDFFNDYNSWILLIIAVSYLLGSIPTAYLIARVKRVNIFEVGSGNMGATNVGRALGLGWGVAVMALDMFKGIIALTIAAQLAPGSNAAAVTIAAISVIFGHNWSVFASLIRGSVSGGKGAATAFGTLLVIAPIPVILVATIIGLILLVRTRYVSLAVLTTFLLSLLWLSALALTAQVDATFIIYTLTVGSLILLRFRENIQRLLTGTERRLGERV